MAHRRRARRLHPDHRRPRLDLAPAPRHVGQIGPDIAAMTATRSVMKAVARRIVRSISARSCAAAAAGRKSASKASRRAIMATALSLAPAEEEIGPDRDAMPRASLMPKPWPPSGKRWVSVAMPRARNASRIINVLATGSPDRPRHDRKQGGASARMLRSAYAARSSSAVAFGAEQVEPRLRMRRRAAHRDHRVDQARPGVEAAAHRG